MRTRGLTLVEVVIGTALLTVGGGALLLGMNMAMMHTDYLIQMQVAMNAAQGELEQLGSASFDTLANVNGEFAQAWAPSGQCRGMGEDKNCNGQLDTGEDRNGNALLDEPLLGGRLSLQIRNADVRNPNSPAMLDLIVSACWKSRGRQIGEDRNCNGVLNTTPVKEDINNNGLLDSPVMLSTRIARRG